MARLTNLDKENIKKLYEQGKMDSEISKELGIKTQTVQYFRTKNNMPTKFTYSKISKINKKLREKRKEIGLCDDIAIRSKVIEKNIETIEKDERQMEAREI